MPDSLRWRDFGGEQSIGGCTTTVGRISNYSRAQPRHPHSQRRAGARFTSTSRSLVGRTWQAKRSTTSDSLRYEMRLSLSTIGSSRPLAAGRFSAPETNFHVTARALSLAIASRWPHPSRAKGRVEHRLTRMHFKLDIAWRDPDSAHDLRSPMASATRLAAN